MQTHKPAFYVSGIWMKDREEWLGNFEATSDELMNYAMHDAETVEMYELCLDLIISQRAYELWWDEVRNDTMKKSDFRLWVYELWAQNREEREAFGESPLDAKTYFNRYKYWLKREYQYQKNQNKS